MTPPGEHIFSCIELGSATIIVGRWLPKTCLNRQSSAPASDYVDHSIISLSCLYLITSARSAKYVSPLTSQMFCVYMPGIVSVRTAVME